jgi:hypothetical protein
MLLMSLTIHQQGLSATVRPLPSEPSQGLLGHEGAVVWGADEWALDPYASKVGEVACPYVPC